MNEQIQLYEMIAGGKPRDEILTALVLFIESKAPGMICTILLLDPDGTRMWTGAAPNLPAGLSAAINGSSIGPNAGSCGTAAYRGENVFVENIETDPLWVDYKNFFLLHDLHACWSSPFFDGQGHVLGTFAMYHREPSLPTPLHLDLIAIATRIAAACMIRDQALEALRSNEQQLRMVYEHVSDGIFLLEILPGFRFQFLSVNKAFLSSNDLNEDQVIGKEIERVFPASTHQFLLEKYRQAIEGKVSVQWEQVTTPSTGKRNTIVTINPIQNDEGTCTHLVGTVHDLGPSVE